jgi:serine/threonine-protein kinase
MSTAFPNLGKYQILEEIGRGGMGAVYKGHDPFLNRQVAIKLLAPHLVWEKAFVERFMREARAVAQLHHPNIVSIYDVGQDGANYYFVMAYLPGGSLTQLIAQRGRLTPAKALPILRQLADALDYAHGKGLIHRDVMTQLGSLAFSPDGKLLASASSDVTIKVWDVASGRERRSLTGHTRACRA